MKHLLFVLLLFPLSVSAQNTQVNAIKQQLMTYDSLIDQAKDEDLDFTPPHFTINSNLMERAIGEVNTKTTIYFDIQANEDDDEPKDTSIIRKVEVNINSVSYNINKTYFFNSKGQLIYYSITENGYSCYTKQFYYNQNCFFVMFKQHKTDNCDEENSSNDYNSSKLTKEDLKASKTIKITSNYYRQLLNTYFYFLRG